MEVAVVGAGAMGLAYVQVLRHMGIAARVYGRGAESARRFAEQSGIVAGTGPLAEQLAARPVAGMAAIVAVDVPELAGVCEALLQAGAAKVLVEKPGALDPARMAALAAFDAGRAIRVAYNRRFLPSAVAARRCILDDGGAQTLHFEFTELPDRLLALGVHSGEVLANWVYANSSHVFDLAFFLAGAARELDGLDLSGAVRDGRLDWFGAGSRFAGCGRVGEGCLFTYSADWRSGGGWGVEVTTPKRRLRLRPLESLTQQMRETFAVDPVALEAEVAGLKPGLRGMVENFLFADGSLLPDMQMQARRMAAFGKMVGMADLPPGL